MTSVRALKLRAVDRPWGGLGVPSLGIEAPPGRKIGEWWVEAPDFPLLVKVLDATATLSIQLHPDAHAARELGLAGAKTEAWFVLRADPGAFVLVGLESGVDPERFFAAAERGEDVSRQLVRITPNPGDTIFVPAGTVHTIGPGMCVLEVQERPDVTLRIFDYGRAPRRELHIAAARRAYRANQDAGLVPPAPIPESDRLSPSHALSIDCELFRVERLFVDRPITFVPARPELWFCSAGAARFASGDAAVDLAAGGFCRIDPRGETSITPTSLSSSLFRIRTP